MTANSLQSIDRDKVLPNDFDYSHLNKPVKPILTASKETRKSLKELNEEQKAAYMGFNHSNAEHRKLGVEIDVEELAKTIRDFERNYDPVNDKLGYLNEKLAQAIAQNPGILKLVRIPSVDQPNNTT